VGANVCLVGHEKLINAVGDAPLIPHCRFEDVTVMMFGLVSGGGGNVQPETFCVQSIIITLSYDGVCIIGKLLLMVRTHDFSSSPFI
jgi:hypothetical protein